VPTDFPSSFGMTVAGLEPARASACNQESLALPFTITTDDCLLARRCPAQAWPRYQHFPQSSCVMEPVTSIPATDFRTARLWARGQLMALCPCLLPKSEKPGAPRPCAGIVPMPQCPGNVPFWSDVQ